MPRLPTRIPGRWLTGLVACAGCISSTTHAGDWSGTVAVSSQLVDLGVAVTRDTPVVQGGANWLSRDGWAVGVFTSYQTGAPRHWAEGIVQVAKAWQASDNWQLQGNLLHYRYPSSDKSARALDRTELGGTLMYRDVLALSVWTIELAHRPGGLRSEADAGLRWPLTAHLSASAAVGIAQYLAPYRWYPNNKRPDWFSYGHAGLRWDNGPWQIEVLRIASNFQRTRYEPPIAPWVMTVARHF